MKTSKAYIKRWLSNLLAGLLFTIALFSFWQVPALCAGNREYEAKQAWRVILPTIEVFWQEYQTAPAKLKDDAWPLISMLKNFIKAYPDSKMLPEAYYILGEAYASVSFWPEAEAHWKIVTRYFPNSKWTNQALTSLILYYERTNNQKKLRRFYREIMRRFPDSIAARTAEVFMARQALLRGNVQKARQVARQVSKASPTPEVDVPELLDLKARLALHDGKPKKAIEMWVRYLNLTRNPASRASTLFQIAETYRRMGDVLKARKYYALIRRDFKGQPEYLFARFRMLQLKEQAREQLARYTKGQVSMPDFYESEMVFQKILKEFPKHPLTREVKKEFVATELKKKDYLKALLLAEEYLREDPNSPYSKDILLMADQAKNYLLETSYDLDHLKRIVSSLKPYLTIHEDSQIYDFIRRVAHKKWVELQQELLSQKRPIHALQEYWRFREFFNDSSALTKEAKSNAVKALLQADETFIANGNNLKLINFYLSNKSKIDRLGVPGHYLYLARAYANMGLDQASLRAYQKAWNSDPDHKLRCTILMEWTGQIVKAKRFKAAQDTITLMNLYCPEQSIGAKALLYKSKLALWQKDYRAGLNMALDSMNMKPEPESVKQALLSAIYLAEWNTVKKIYAKHSKLLKKQDKIKVLRTWGDEALNLGQPKEALKPYKALNNIEPDEPANKFRLNLALASGKRPSKAARIWTDASKEVEGLWNTVFKAEASFYKFMEKAGGTI